MKKVKVLSKGTCADKPTESAIILEKLEKEWDEEQDRIKKIGLDIALEYLAYLGVKEETISIIAVYLDSNNTLHVSGRCNKNNNDMHFSILLTESITEVKFQGVASRSEYNNRSLITNHIELTRFIRSENEINVSIKTGDRFIESPIIDDYERWDKGGSEFETNDYVKYYSEKEATIGISELNLIFLEDFLAQESNKKEQTV